MMDSKLETLIKVNETRSFTKAAELLSLTQPAVSGMLTRLREAASISASWNRIWAQRSSFGGRAP